MGSIKDRNGMDLTEAEDIKKRWQEYTEELYKKDLHDPYNHDGVITHLEPDILNVKSSNIDANKYIKQILIDIREEADNNTVIAGNFNTPLINRQIIQTENL